MKCNRLHNITEGEYKTHYQFPLVSIFNSLHTKTLLYPVCQKLLKPLAHDPLHNIHLHLRI